MRTVIREDFDGYYVLSVVDERNRLIWRRDGTARVADSRDCENPYAEIEKPHGQKPIAYNSRGIV